MRSQEEAIRDAEIYNEYQFGDKNDAKVLADQYGISEDKIRHIINRRRYYAQESLTRIKDDYFLCNLYLDLLKHDNPSRTASRIVVCLYSNKVNRTMGDVKDWCINYIPVSPDTNHPGYRNFGRTCYIALKKYLTQTGQITSEDEEKINEYNKPITRYVINVNGSPIYYKTKKAAENDLRAFRVYEEKIHEIYATDIYTVEFGKA